MNRKIIVLALCAALLVGGCATVKTILGTVQTVVCSFTVDEVLDAVEALEFFEAFPALKEKYKTAVNVFQNVRDKVCESMPRLQIAVDAIDEIAVIVQGQAAVRGVMIKPVAVQVPKIPALRALVHK